MLDAQPATVYPVSPDDPSHNSKFGFWTEHHCIYFLTIVLLTIVAVGMKFYPTCRQRRHYKREGLLKQRGVLFMKERRRMNTLFQGIGEKTKQPTTTCRKDGSAATTRVVQWSLTLANIIKKKYRHNLSWNYASKHAGLHWRQKKSTASTEGPVKPSIPARHQQKDATSGLEFKNSKGQGHFLKGHSKTRARGVYVSGGHPRAIQKGHQ